MPTLVPKRQLHTEDGFSLLEILVVLAIMATMLTLVGARMVQSIESAYFAKTSDAAIADIVALRADAVIRRHHRILITDTTVVAQYSEADQQLMRRLEVPETWTVRGEAIHISSTGTCFGGLISIETPKGRKSVYELVPPKCRSRRVSEVLDTANIPSPPSIFSQN